MATLAELRRLLRAFVDGIDRSIVAAGQIEVMLDELFDEQEPYASAALALASYRPGGGEFLYSEQDMVPMLSHVLDSLDSSASGP